jgi:hypothetical protein
MIKPRDAVLVAACLVRRLTGDQATRDNTVNEAILGERVGESRVGSKARDVENIVESAGRQAREAVVVVGENLADPVRAMLRLVPLGDGKAVEGGVAVLDDQNTLTD